VVEPKLSWLRGWIVAEMPLSGERRGVAVSLEHSGPSHRAGPQADATFIFLLRDEVGNPELCPVASREERRTARRAHGRGGEGTDETCPFRRDAVEIWRERLLAAVATRTSRSPDHR